MSIRAKFVVSIVKKKANFNPERVSDPVSALQKSLNFPTHYSAPKGYTVEKANIDGLPVEIFKKKDCDSVNAIYYLHGGAYIGGLNDAYRYVQKKFSKFFGDATVIMPDYRLAPDFKFPSQLDDATKCWNWLLSNGYKEENIVIGGDSAGGNLALALMLTLRDSKKTLPKGAFLISPWADMLGRGDSYMENYRADAMFGGISEPSQALLDELLECGAFSFCKGLDRKNPLISPVYGDYHGFPPTVFTVGGDEILLSDSQTITKKLTEAGCKTSLHVGNEMFHIYTLLCGFMPESKRAMKAVTDFLTELK